MALVRPQILTRLRTSQHNCLYQIEVAERKHRAHLPSAEIIGVPGISAPPMATFDPLIFEFERG